MTRQSNTALRIFFDADVIFAGAASHNEHSASLVLLRMAELTLINAITSQQVITEVERNLLEKIPKALPAFHLLASRCLHVVSDPVLEELTDFQGQADTKDLPILVAAFREKCEVLTTYNVRHFQPGKTGLAVMKPGDVVIKVRYLLTGLPGD
jgi:predicted nucleic acid-binding protein